MDEIRIAILLGLHATGRAKTFAQILDTAKVAHTSEQELEAAHSLEALGLIESVTHSGRTDIRAELSSFGKEYLESKSYINNRGRNSRS